MTNLLVETESLSSKFKQLVDHWVKPTMSMSIYEHVVLIFLKFLPLLLTFSNEFLEASNKQFIDKGLGHDDKWLAVGKRFVII